MMVTDDFDLETGDASAGVVRPELMISTVLHLMSHYTINLQKTGACVKLASVIERHLQALADLPNLAPVLRATCEQLSEQWATIVERAMPMPITMTMTKKSNFFMRLVRNERLS
jgi:hypothetical protein